MDTPDTVTKSALCHYKICTSMYYTIDLLLLQHNSLRVIKYVDFIAQLVYIKTWVTCHRSAPNLSTYDLLLPQVINLANCRPRQIQLFETND